LKKNTKQSTRRKKEVSSLEKNAPNMDIDYTGRNQVSYIRTGDAKIIGKTDTDQSTNGSAGTITTKASGSG